MRFETNCDFYLLGGGKAGNNGTSSNGGQWGWSYNNPGAGGQGGYVTKLISGVTVPAGTYAVTIGAGGTGNGGQGGSSIFTDGNGHEWIAHGGGSNATLGTGETAGANGGSVGWGGTGNSWDTYPGSNATVEDFDGVKRGGGGGGGSSEAYWDWGGGYNYSSASNGGTVGGGRGG